MRLYRSCRCSNLPAALLSRGFSASNLGDATLANLRSSDGAPTAASDMRDTVCTKGAQADRWDGRDVEGRMTINSPYITAMTREPQTVLVGLGGATGPGGAANDNVEIANVPIPTPRPQHVNGEIVPMALTGETTLRKGMPLPSAKNN